MYYIGIKQNGFNPNNLLSENSAHWLTYFNPDSKLKIQTANHWNSAGVKEFSDLEDAKALLEEVQSYGIKDSFLAKIEGNDTQVVSCLNLCWYYVSIDFWRMLRKLKDWMLFHEQTDAFDKKNRFEHRAQHLHKVNESDLGRIRELVGKYIAWEQDFRPGKEAFENAMRLLLIMDTVQYGNGCKDISLHESAVTPWPPKD